MLYNPVQKYEMFYLEVGTTCRRDVGRVAVDEQAQVLTGCLHRG
jgi:hypothetical protein